MLVSRMTHQPTKERHMWRFAMGCFLVLYRVEACVAFDEIPRYQLSAGFSNSLANIWLVGQNFQQVCKDL